ncbi:hypothetical protein J437_LFUL014541 [Ladona fulva]|uniref:Receptor ligand binding region domain-containing protein n=1 Tax=Ladona fulva TaxID=123851 RepID=A0A8K0P541_LADFU|nr:hypothetical protein J437_LFUL014541 [Ladona fulva]
MKSLTTWVISQQNTENLRAGILQEKNAELFLVSYGSTSPALSDRREFPLFYRTVAPDSSHNPARLAFVRRFRWDTVTALSQNEDVFSLDTDTRIIIGSFSQEVAPKIFCEAGNNTSKELCAVQAESKS